MSLLTRVDRRLRRILQSGSVVTLLVLVASVILWQLVIMVFGVEDYVLPRPAEVAAETVENFGIIMNHTMATAIEMLAGFGLAAIAGVGLGSIMVYFPILDRIFSPPVVILQTVPKVALAPVFVVWFGTSMTPRVLVALVIAFFPILIDTMVGLRSTRVAPVELTRSMGASRWQVFRKVEFPSSLPNIFGGLRVAATLVVIGAVVGEYIAANEGLGYLQIQASITLNTALVFTAIIFMSILGLILYKLVEYAERLAIPWHRREI